MRAHETLRLEAQQDALTVANHAQADAAAIRKLRGQLSKALRALKEAEVD